MDYTECLFLYRVPKHGSSREMPLRIQARMRWNCRVQGPDKRNVCVVGYLVPSVSCTNLQCLYIIITENRWKYLYLSRKITIFVSFALLLWLHYRRRGSASPVKNFRLSCVILYIIFPFSLECTWFKLGWYIFLVFLASVNCRCPNHLKHWRLIKIPMLTSLYNFSVLHRFAEIRHTSLFLML
jgi:hypothetical protein